MTFHEIRPLLPCLGQAQHDRAPALRAALARARALRRARLRLQLLRRAPFPPRRKLDVVARALRGRRPCADQAPACRHNGFRRAAAPPDGMFWADGNAAGHDRKPNVGYSTVVYVDETDQKALDTALFRASRAYEGLLPLAEPGETFEDRLKKQPARFEARG